MNREDSARTSLVGRCTTFSGVVLAALLFWAPPATAATAGDLDKSFDTDGVAVTDVFGQNWDWSEAVAVQPDGKIVVAGTWGGGAARSNFVLVRYNQNGSLDKSFGSAGRVMTDFDGDDDKAYAVAVSISGKIVVAGTALYGTNPVKSAVALARYESDGDLDPTFSNDGKKLIDFGGSDRALDVAIQRDGKIVFAGERIINADTLEDFIVGRVTSSGARDTTFSGDGRAYATFGEGREAAKALAIQADNKIVVAGWAHDDGDTDFALARYNPDGRLDPTFDGNGTLLTGFGEDEVANDIALDTNGTIVAAGRKESDFAVARYNRNGSPDTTFDSDGKRSINLGAGETAAGVAVQTDHKIVIAGTSSPTGYFYGDVLVARLTTSGALDNTFSGNGWLTQGVSEGDYTSGMALQRDGRIVVSATSGIAGAEDNGDEPNFATLRFHARTE